MLALYGFLGGCVLLVMAGIAVWFIVTMRSLKTSLDNLSPQFQLMIAQVERSSSQVNSKVTEAMSQMSSVAPFFTVLSGSVPEFINTGREIAGRITSFHKLVDQFYKIVLAQGGQAPASNNTEESGFWGYNESDAAAAEAAAEQYKRTGVRIPREEAEVSITEAPRVPVRNR